MRQPSYLTGKNRIGALLWFRNTAIYLRPRGHYPVQCMEMRRKRRKGLVQRVPSPRPRGSDATSLAVWIAGRMRRRQGTRALPGSAAQSSGWPRAQNPAPWLGYRIQGPERLLRGLRAPMGRWRCRARRRAEGAPAPPGSLVRPHPTCAKTPRPGRRGGTPRQVGFPASSLLTGGGPLSGVVKEQLDGN